MRDECSRYYEDEDRFKCMAGHACYCRFGEACPDYYPFSKVLDEKAQQKKDGGKKNGSL